jgi:hypothetical protein
MTKMATVKKMSKKRFERVIENLNTIVRSAASADESALAGLTAVAAAFGALLDVYAAPNPDNAEGMCDDKAAFRKYFADIIVSGPA